MTDDEETRTGGKVISFFLSFFFSFFRLSRAASCRNQDRLWIAGEWIRDGWFQVVGSYERYTTRAKVTRASAETMRVSQPMMIHVRGYKFRSRRFDGRIPSVLDGTRSGPRSESQVFGCIQGVPDRFQPYETLPCSEDRVCNKRVLRKILHTSKWSKRNQCEESR